MTQIRLRSDVGSAWATANPTLAVGEVGISTVINRFKVGDGSTPWNSLPFQGINSTNLFLNGDFSVDEHKDLIFWGLGTGTTPTSTTKYAADRWRCYIAGTPTTNGAVARGEFRVELVGASYEPEAITGLPITYPVKQFARTNTGWRGENLTSRSISQRVECPSRGLQGAYTLSFWARSKDSSTRTSWISPWFQIEGGTATAGAGILLTTSWKRYAITADIDDSVNGTYFEAGVNLPLVPGVTWATAPGTSSDKITVATTVSGTPLVVKTADTTGLVAGAKIRLVGSASGTTDKVLEGVINTVVANTSVSIDVYLVSGTGTAEAWTIYVSMYAAGTVTPSRSNSVTITTNIAADSVAVNDYVLLRCRATPGNWMYGKVLSKTATSITIKTNEVDGEGTNIGDFGGVASSGWDINREVDNFEIDLFGFQLEPDRGASQFHLATGHPVSEAVACKRYFEQVYVGNMITMSNSSDRMLGVIWYSEKYSTPTISYTDGLIVGQSTAGGAVSSRTISSITSSSPSLTNCRVQFNISGSSFVLGSAGYGQVTANVLAEI